MLSLSKLLLLAVAIAVVWFGFKWWQRHQLAAGKPAPRAQDRHARHRGSRAGDVEDMRACAVCGTYVATGAGPCERTDCPRRAT